MIGEATPRPWWQSSFMWDAFSSGGVGMTGPVFHYYGPGDGVIGGLEGYSDSEKRALASFAIIGGSVFGGLLGYGLFGYLRDKGYGPWTSGALVGLLGGIGALGMMKGMEMVTGKTFIGRLR